MIQGEDVYFEVDDKLALKVQRTDAGYVVDAYTTKDELYLETMTIWDDDIEETILESSSICDTAEMEELGVTEVGG